MSHASAASRPVTDRPSSPTTVTDWASWVLTVAVVIVLAVSFALWQQVDHLEESIEQYRTEETQFHDTMQVRQCLILTRLNATGEQMAAAGCEGG